MTSRPLSRSAYAPLILAAILALTAQLAHAQEGASASGTSSQGKKATPLNAHMNITYLGPSGRVLKGEGWSGAVAWTGPIPARYEALIQGSGAIEWIGEKPEKDSIRVMTTARGAGGESLSNVRPARATGLTVVVISLSEATGENKAPRSTRRPTTNDESKPAPPKVFRPKQDTRRQQPPPDPRARRPHKSAEAFGTRKRAPAPKESAAVGDAPSVKGKKQSEKPPSLGDGEEESEDARQAAVTGSGGIHGAQGGETDGKSGGKTEEQGGMRAPNASARGKGSDAEGMKGGSGPNGSQGLPSGGGLIPLITIPASLRHLSDTLLILKDVSPTKIATSWMGKITAKTTVRSLRKRIKKEAAAYASARMTSYATEIQEALKHMTRREQQQALNRWAWEIERQYFDRVERGAAAEVRKLRKAAASTDQIRKAEMVREAAKVKPMAGQLPRNHSYAGQSLPARKLPPAYRKKGLQIKPNGHPNFNPHAVRLPNGQYSVKIKLTGDLAKDQRIANKAAGFSSSGPSNKYTWHHHEDGTTMQLVPADLHKQARHSGGQAMYRHRTGDPTAYR